MIHITHRSTKRSYVLLFIGITVFCVASFVDSAVASSDSVFRTPMILAFIVGAITGLGQSRDAWVDRLVLLGTVALAFAAKHVSLLMMLPEDSAYNLYISSLAVGVMFCIALAGRAKPLFIAIALMAAKWIGSPESICASSYWGEISQHPIRIIVLWMCALIAGAVFGYAESVRCKTSSEAAETQAIDTADRPV